jgi:type II secretory pathway component PulF
MWEKFQLKFQQISFDLKAQQAFLEDIAALVEDGVPLKQALEVYANLSHGASKTLANNMLQRISEGKYVADGMIGWFPPGIVEMIRAGEEGGILPKVLRTAAASLTKREGALSALFNIMIYPFVVMSMAFGVSIFINHSIFDSFRAITPMDRWPENAKILAGFSSFMQDWWWLILLTLIVLIFLFIRFLRGYSGEGRVYLDKLPIWSLYKKMQAAQLMETLGLLISNGLVMKKALKILQYRAEPYLASHLILMEHRLGAGRDNIADVLDTGLISEGDLSRLRLIAQVKGFEEALVRQGQRAADEGSKSIRTNGKIFAGALLGFAALFAIFMITSVYSAGFAIVPT